MKIVLVSIISIIIIIFVIFLTPKYESYLSPPKIVHLVLYSESDDYRQMYETTRPYYKGFPIVTLYYTYSGSSDPPYIKDDILYLPGKESFIPGVLNKTIDAFQWASERYEFDYIIRSNISTVINIPGVISELSSEKIDYGGGFVGPLSTVGSGYGVKEQHIGTIYSSGTFIILSKEAIDTLLKTRGDIQYDVIDDVSIGLWAKGRYVAKQVNSQLFYRNRTSDRKNDVLNMKNQINSFIPKPPNA